MICHVKSLQRTTGRLLEQLIMRIGWSLKVLGWPRTDGILYVLLCRATCGHIYYTEKDWDSGADGPAKKSGRERMLKSKTYTYDSSLFHDLSV